MEPSSADNLLARARGGDEAALSALLEKYRPYLVMMAQRQFDSQLQSRVDPSDVVQQTCLEAYRDLAKFRGEAEAEWMAWLRRILENNVFQAVSRHVVAQKRTTRREQRLDDSTGGDRHLHGQLAAKQSSPSRRLMRSESAATLDRALAELPADQREAVRLRHIEGCSLAEMAARIGRSELAVAGLLKRGLRGLRKQLAEIVSDEFHE